MFACIWSSITASHCKHICLVECCRLADHTSVDQSNSPQQHSRYLSSSRILQHDLCYCVQPFSWQSMTQSCLLPHDSRHITLFVSRSNSPWHSYAITCVHLSVECTMATALLWSYVVKYHLLSHPCEQASPHLPFKIGLGLAQCD